MTQVINIPGVQAINTDLLHSQLLTAAPSDCFGLSLDVNGVHIIVSDTIAPALLTTLKNLCSAHDPTVQTPAQVAEKEGKADSASLLAAADTALTQLAAKQATFQATPTLTNAAPLLLEISQDVQNVIKAMKYIVKRMG